MLSNNLRYTPFDLKHRFVITGAFLLLLLTLSNNTLKAQQRPVQAVKLFFEKVYLHTDRDVYWQGDTIWYKAYLVNAQGNALISTSNNLYTELISRDSSKMIAREIVRLDQGTGHADFALSDSIPPGKYRLRSYTNWMRNFGDNFIFQKEITILGNTARPQNQELTVVKGNGVNIDPLRPAQVNPGGINLRFFPESGSMVEGVPSIVAVEAKSKNGKGLAIKGGLLNQTGDTVSSFTCDTLGFGLFLITPVKGQSYHAVSKTTGSPSFSVPPALAKGYVLRVSNRDSLINVVISCNELTLADSTGRKLTLSVKHAGKTYFSKAIQLTGDQALVRIPASMLPDGISAVTLLDTRYELKKQPQCERLVYVRHEHKGEYLNVSADKVTYHSKEKVVVTIKSGGAANLSLAAVDAYLSPIQETDIATYLNLQSEVRGNIANPEGYFDTTNVNRFKQLDLLLMTQGWRDFLWRRLADTAIRISYTTENAIAVSGRILNGRSDKPLINSNITLFANAATGVKLFSARSDSAGTFMFNIRQYGDHSVKLTASNSKGDKTGAFAIDTLSLLPLPVTTRSTTNQTDTSTVSMQQAGIMRRLDVVAQKLKETHTLKEVKITGSRAVILGNGTPYVSWGKDQVFDITPKDYPMKTLEWWALHNIKGAVQSEDAGVTGVVIRCVDTANCLPKSKLLPPQFFVNGRDYSTDNDIEAETYRTTYYPLSIDKFKRIVVKHLVTIIDPCRIDIDRYLIYITLKDDALVGYNPGAINPEISGYYEPDVFYKPLYENTKNLTKPDLRTTIHWEPNIYTDADGNATVTFYNADPKSRTRIVVQGVTEKGVPLSGNYVYSVN